MSTFFISVIIPIYNVEHFFEKCLRSLFEQTLDSIEYLFINDCTPDNSMEVLNKILEEYPNRKKQVRIINHEHNMGSGAARTDGMKAATGRYVIHCDSDDWIELDMYEKMYNKAVEEDADIVCCGFCMEYSNKKIKLIYPDIKKSDKELMKELRWNSIVYSSLCNKLVKRNLYVNYDVYPFNEINMWEDVGVMTRLRYYSKKTEIMYEALYHYRMSNETSITSVPNLYKIEEQMQCAKNLEIFLREQNASEEFFIFIQNIKFMSKYGLLRYKAVRNIKRWKMTYPESHKYIWKYTNFSRSQRIVYWLAANGFFFPFILLDLRRVIRSIRKR